VVDMLFPKGTEGRIPIIAITGTNGKTTTTRITSHIVRTAGKKVGYTTSDGIYIQNQLMMSGDCTGPVSAEFVLKDPTVDFAVLECARGGILRGGLGFRHCNVAIVTNVAADHLGLGGINSVEQMARVKQVVPETVCDDGYAILNADDDLVYRMKDDLDCKIALFSMRDDNPRIKKHCENGGKACIYENGYVTIVKENWKIPVMAVKDIPITYGGKATHNIANVLPAVMATYLFKTISIDDIRQALQTFIPSSAQTPGRLNFFQLKKCTYLADFAHNPHGLQLLCEFIDELDYPQKIGIITGTGDRRNEDIIELGKIASKYFDQIILRTDKDTRGKTKDEIIGLLQEGIKQVDPELPVKIIPDETEALAWAYDNSEKGALITVMCDKVDGTIDKIKNLKATEEQNHKSTISLIP
jgi:cyanophycin synthetase